MGGHHWDRQGKGTNLIGQTEWEAPGGQQGAGVLGHWQAPEAERLARVEGHGAGFPVGVTLLQPF